MAQSAPVRITVVLTPEGRLRRVLCDRPASVVRLREDLTAHELPPSERPLSYETLAQVDRRRVAVAHEAEWPTPPERPRAVRATVSIPQGVADILAAECAKTGDHPGKTAERIIRTWVANRKAQRGE